MSGKCACVLSVSLVSFGLFFAVGCEKKPPQGTVSNTNTRPKDTERGTTTSPTGTSPQARIEGNNPGSLGMADFGEKKAARS